MIGHPQFVSRLARGLRFVAAGRLFDAVLTLFILNILLLLLRDDYRISLFGLTLFSPTLVPSLVAVVLWVGAGRLARGEVSSEVVIGWVSRHAPEVVVGALVLVGLALRLWGLQFQRRARLRRRLERLREFSPEDGYSLGPTIGVYLNHPGQ